MEHLKDQQSRDRMSLGVFKPKKVHDLVISEGDADWKRGFKAALAQARLWETRTVSKEPPRKMSYKFHYLFECDDGHGNGNHRKMIEDWEVGALYRNLVDKGASHQEASQGVRAKFLNELCGSDKDTHFFVGTIQKHPKSWVVIGVFWPKIKGGGKKVSRQPTLFD